MIQLVVRYEEINQAIEIVVGSQTWVVRFFPSGKREIEV